MAEALSGPALEAMYRDFANAYKVLSKDEEYTMQKLSALSAAFLKEKAKRLVMESEGRPVLYSYGSDGTPMLTKFTSSAKTASSRTVVRKAGRVVEFLLQRGFVRTNNAAGAPQVAALLAAPIPLDLGKSAYNLFTALCEFFPVLRKLGHTGICISHFAFDRAAFSAMQKRLHQRTALYYEVAAAGGPKEGEVALAELLDWVVVTPCANHNVQNSLKWGMLSVATDPELLSHLHIAIESVRNGFDLLYQRLGAFVAGSLTFVANTDDPQKVYAFWVNLGVDSETADTLADLNLWWHMGRLQVDERRVSDPDLAEKVIGAMLSVFRFKKFTDSRWLTIGDSCRSLTAALHLGLAGLVHAARADPDTSDFYLHGFARLATDTERWAALASLAACAPDAALAEMLEDDRLALSIQSICKAMNDEILWLGRIDGFTWERLASRLQGHIAQELRSDALRVAHVACAFFQRRAVIPACKYPWSLLQGDMQTKFTALRDGPDQLEETTSKIQKLLRLGYDRQKLESAVRLMGEVSWTTTIVEQGHGSVAVVHRVHSEYSPATLAARGMVHMMRSLLPALGGPDVARPSVQRKAVALKRKRPQVLSGRNVFVRECFAAARSSLTGDEVLSSEKARGLMRSHSAMFNALPDDDKAQYEAKARHEKFENAASVNEDLLAIAEHQRLQKRRRVEADSEDSHCFRISACRLSAADLGAMAELWVSEAWSKGRSGGLRASAMVAPAAPSAEVRAQLESMEVVLPDHDSRATPPWCAIVCRHREVFASCIFAFVQNAQETYYLFLYATQSPFTATFMSLNLLDRPLPASDPRSWGTWLDSPLRRPAFEFHTGRRYAREVDIPFPDGTEMFVIPKAFFPAAGQVATYAEPLAFQSFVKGLPASAPKASSAAPKARTPEIAKLLAEFPWLENYVSQGKSGKLAGGSTKKATPTGGSQNREATDLTEGEVESIFEVLEKRRREWAQVYSTKREDFDTTLLGGGWTQAHRGVEMDASLAFARGKQRKAWCKKRGLGQQASFSLALYGEPVAMAMAEYWADRMQYFYSLCRESNKDMYQPSASEVEAAPTPDHVRELCLGLPGTHPVWSRLAEIQAITLS